MFKSFVDEIGVEELDAMLAACAGGACNDANDYFWTGQSAMTCSGNWKVAQIPSLQAGWQLRRGAHARSGWPRAPCKLGRWLELGDSHGHRRCGHRV